MHREHFRHHFGDGLDTYIIRLQCEGVCEALVEGTMTEIVPGDLLLFKPGDVYDLRIGAAGEPMKPSGDYYVMGTGAGLDEWWGAKSRPTKTKIAEDSRIKAVWQQLILEKRRLDGGHPELVSLLVHSLLMLLDRAVEEAPKAQSASAFHALRMRSYIDDHATSPLKLEDVARHTQLSVSRAVHLFKEHFGVTIIGYVQEVRLAHALNLLLHSPMSLEQIASASGLGSYAYFHRVFRARYGMSPGAYRKKRFSAHG